MAQINMGDVMGCVNKWAVSYSGRNEIKKALGDGANGVDLDARKIEMIAAGQEMLALLKQHGASAGLPASVMSHIESFTASAPVVNDDGSGTITLTMASDPSRPSLCPERYGGVSDIVAIFNNGYEANASVYGHWANHEQTMRTSAGKIRDGSAFVKSRPQREGLGFMQSAVAEFNATCGGKYNVFAVLGGPYG